MKVAGWIAAFTVAAATLAHAQDLDGPASRTSGKTVAPCVARAPGPGQVVHGAVLQVIDERTMCVAVSPDPESWIRVMVDGLSRENSRGALMAAAFAKPVDCVIDRRAPEGTLARCIVEGTPLPALVREDAVIKASFDWR